MPVPSVLARYNAFDGPRVIADMWSASKDGRTIHCALLTHALGWELRVATTDEFARTEVCKTQPEVFDTSAKWRIAAGAKGWI